MGGGRSTTDGADMKPQPVPHPQAPQPASPLHRSLCKASAPTSLLHSQDTSGVAGRSLQFSSDKRQENVQRLEVDRVQLPLHPRGQLCARRTVVTAQGLPATGRPVHRQQNAAAGGEATRQPAGCLAARVCGSLKPPQRLPGSLIGSGIKQTLQRVHCVLVRVTSLSAV